MQKVKACCIHFELPAKIKFYHVKVGSYNVLVFSVFFFASLVCCQNSEVVTLLIAAVFEMAEYLASIFGTEKDK